MQCIVCNDIDAEIVEFVTDLKYPLCWECNNKVVFEITNMSSFREHKIIVGMKEVVYNLFLTEKRADDKSLEEKYENILKKLNNNVIEVQKDFMFIIDKL